MFGKPTFTYSSACQAEVAVSAESKLQEFLEFGSVCNSAKIEVQLCFCLQIATTKPCDKHFWERPSLWLVETLQSTFLWSAPLPPSPQKKRHLTCVEARRARSIITCHHVMHPTYQLWPYTLTVDSSSMTCSILIQGLGLLILELI
jgi:hypothetical protein